MTAELRTQLEALLEAGSMARTACSRRMMTFLRPFLDSKVVVEDRAGAGRRLCVRRPAELRSAIQRAFPNVQLPPEALGRVVGVARTRDSKSSAGDTPDILLVRGWADDVLWRDGVPVPVAEQVAVHGVFSLVLHPDRYELRRPCALVEGPVALLQFEQLYPQKGLPLVLYGGGRLSRRAVTWLGRQNAPDFRLMHFPDYDPVGMSEFARVRSVLGSRVTIHLPENLAEMFDRFSKRKLVQRKNSQTLLRRLRTSEIPEVRSVLALMDRHNAGLEQEALLIPPISR